MTEKSANNVRGFLLYSPFTKQYFFRTYNEDKTFIDYDLCAEDIEIQIVDDALSLYVGTNRNKIDYTSNIVLQ